MTKPRQRLIVTGGAGFIGSHLVRRLLAGGAEVLNLDKLSYAGHLSTIADLAGQPRHHFLQLDLATAPELSQVVGDFRPDAILHLAAETHVDRSLEDSSTFVQSNIVGTSRLLDAALAHWRRLPAEQRPDFRFLQVSTDEVFGSLGEAGCFTEQSPYAPRSPYAASKAAADHLVRAAYFSHGLPILISHSSNNYGPSQFPEKLIPLITLKALRGETLPIFGDGQQVRDWLHVEDHAAALEILLAQGRPGESYCIGASQEQRNLDLVRQICTALDHLRPSTLPYSALIEFVPDRPGHDRRYALDSGKFRRETDWTPKTGFKTGLEETLRWYLEHPTWCAEMMLQSPLKRRGLEP
ncbi:MAG: hypothetical protein RL095_362 [Verrucomicrobiota bacterium]|jgi:dTDP-glucose 4,6-dehydratase